MVIVQLLKDAEHQSIYVRVFIPLTSMFVKMVSLVSLVALNSLSIVSARFHVMQNIIPRNTFVKVAESTGESIHELVFAIQQKNLVEFDEMLLERSTPGNPLYQNWFTFEEVGQITSNREGANEVKAWLAANGITASWESAHKDYIKASAPISKWEKLLDTKFYHWEDHSRGKDAKGVQRFMHRAEQYSLPEEVKPHLFAVFNTVQVPPVFKPKYQKLSGNAEPMFKTSFSMKPSKHDKNLRTEADIPNGYVTVQFLNEYYDITSNEGNATMSQSVFETAEESFSPTDLTLFQQTFGLPLQSCEAPYGFSTDDCTSNDCGEGNLDVQYIMGVAQNTTTIYWYVADNTDSDPFVAFVTDIANTANPPKVNSMSWGSVEQGSSQDVLGAFNTEAMKLTSMGVTILVSAGDNGAASSAEYCNYDSSSAAYDTWEGPAWRGKGYFPSFPATSPYVTAVGGTMWPEVGDPEIACQSQLGGVITTGGGFSTYNPTPSWQQSAVDAYFEGLVSEQQPTDGYNPNGRGYPDVSLISVWYLVLIQGDITPIFGTSASAPVFAAFVSLANAARARNNKTTLGFLNPTIYYNGSANPYFNDVNSGHNMCMAYGDTSDPSGATCCNSGFYATTGWDPLTGFGSVNYSSLVALFDAQNVSFVVQPASNSSADTDDHDDSITLTDSGLTTSAWVSVAVGIVVCVALLVTATINALDMRKGYRKAASNATGEIALAATTANPVSTAGQSATV